MNTKPVTKKAERPLVQKDKRRISIPPELFYPFYLQSNQDPKQAEKMILDVLQSHLMGVLNPAFYHERGLSLAPLVISHSAPPPSTSVPDNYPTDWFT